MDEQQTEINKWQLFNTEVSYALCSQLADKKYNLFNCWRNDSSAQKHLGCYKFCNAFT